MPKATKQLGTLYLRTREMLVRETRSLEDISAASGISLFWLRKLRYAETTDPSVHRVQALYEYLTGRPLLP